MHQIVQLTQSIKNYNLLHVEKEKATASRKHQEIRINNHLVCFIDNSFLQYNSSIADQNHSI